MEFSFLVEEEKVKFSSIKRLKFTNCEIHFSPKNVVCQQMEVQQDCIEYWDTKKKLSIASMIQLKISNLLTSCHTILLFWFPSFPHYKQLKMAFFGAEAAIALVRNIGLNQTCIQHCTWAESWFSVLFSFALQVRFEE